MKDDAISRQGVLKLLSTIPPEEAMTKAMLIQSVQQMDAPDNLVKDSQVLAKDLVNDCISRQAAIDALDKRFDSIPMEQTTEILQLRKDLRELPSAQPERKRGEWIEDDDGWDGMIWRCSECDVIFTLIDGTPKENEYYFCPHCGADMREDDHE